VPLLTASAPSRIINVGSLGQVPFDPADAEFEHGYNGVDAYRRSKSIATCRSLICVRWPTVHLR
jgi:hypothetical protein